MPVPMKFSMQNEAVGIFKILLILLTFMKKK